MYGASSPNGTTECVDVLKPPHAYMVIIQLLSETMTTVNLLLRLHVTPVLLTIGIFIGIQGNSSL